MISVVIYLLLTETKIIARYAPSDRSVIKQHYESIM